jgi:hypothetical protein
MLFQLIQIGTLVEYSLRKVVVPPATDKLRTIFMLLYILHCHVYLPSVVYLKVTSYFVILLL